MSEGSRKRPGEPPHEEENKRGRGPKDCLSYSSSDEEEEFTPFTQENPVIELSDDDTTVRAAPDGTVRSSAVKKEKSKKSVAKNRTPSKSFAKNRTPSKSKGKCLGEI